MAVRTLFCGTCAIAYSTFTDVPALEACPICKGSLTLAMVLPAEATEHTYVLTHNDKRFLHSIRVQSVEDD
jgi:hypothetical protein